ncbi:MAG TPA: argininosuccinate lyase [Candidatus Baltobacteraceae bacterium]|jgi:argininosuccinate lyase|nr:argininosuccinate lyase [Candidatus Baltobacteraceae bacterium]
MRKGRFSKPAAKLAQRYTESVSFDWRLYRYDIAGSIAHAVALARRGILTADERQKIENELRAIEREIESGKFQWDQSLEDVHMNIEAALTKRIGTVGGKLHTARSRNDQIALDLRLYVKAEIVEVSNRLRNLQTALLNLAESRNGAIDPVMPGYTHLQRAQPVTFAHYLLGQIEAFERDAERLRDCLTRADVLPLGSGALAGSTIVLDRERIARELGFARVSQNSVDAVSDRDFVCEFLFCLAMIGLHLSRLSEDLIIWSTSEFGFLEFSEAFSTGSSLMPLSGEERNAFSRGARNRGQTRRVLRREPHFARSNSTRENERALTPFRYGCSDGFRCSTFPFAATTIGAPSPENIAAQIKRWRKLLRE